ncbi:MAG TPA: type IV pilus modification protein PilV [Pseudomonas sp.]|nr:type IV pilus modification protein PilV [Pseudomonas sp.]
MNKTLSSSHGFSLIEVLITLVLISIGVLGMVAMQGRTVQYTQDSVQRNTAAMLANDLLELIRTSPAGATDFYKAAGTEFADVPASCAVTTQVPTEQLSCWAQKASKLLPGVTPELLTSDFYICRSKDPDVCDEDEGSAVEIQLVWTVKAGECLDKANANNATSTTCSYRLRTQI